MNQRPLQLCLSVPNLITRGAIGHILDYGHSVLQLWEERYFLGEGVLFWSRGTFWGKWYFLGELGTFLGKGYFLGEWGTFSGNFESWNTFRTGTNIHYPGNRNLEEGYGQLLPLLDTQEPLRTLKDRA